MTTESFLDRLAAPTPTPGGGAASARVGALGCALLRMVTGITLGKIPDGERPPELEAAHRQTEDLLERLAKLEADDAAAFDAFIAAVRLPKSTTAEREERRRARAAAAVRAASAPLGTLSAVRDVLQLADTLNELSHTTPLRAESDLRVGAELARAAARGAALNVEANLPYLDESTAAQLTAECESTAAEIERLYARVV